MKMDKRESRIKNFKIHQLKNWVVVPTLKLH